MKRMNSLFNPPSRKPLIPAAIVLASLIISPIIRAEVVEDFESNPNVIVEANSHDETRNEVTTDPAKAENHVMKISWSPHGGTHVAGSLSAPGPILISEPGTYEITAKVNFEQCGPEVTKMALRVVDSGNETFQFSAPVSSSGEPGWTEVKWTINTSQPDTGGVTSWGDQVNNEIDLPVKFFGFAVDLKDWKTPGGTLSFDDVTVTKISD